MAVGPYAFQTNDIRIKLFNKMLLLLEFCFDYESIRLNCLMLHGPVGGPYRSCYSIAI